MKKLQVVSITMLLSCGSFYSAALPPGFAAKRVAEKSPAEQRLDYLRSRRSPEARQKYLEQLRKGKSKTIEVPVAKPPETAPEKPEKEAKPTPTVPQSKPARPADTLQAFFEENPQYLTEFVPHLRQMNLVAIRRFESQHGLDPTPFNDLVGLHQQQILLTSDPLGANASAVVIQTSLVDVITAPSDDAATLSLRNLARARGWKLGGQESEIASELRKVPLEPEAAAGVKSALDDVEKQVTLEFHFPAYAEIWRIRKNEPFAAQPSYRLLLENFYDLKSASPAQRASFDTALRGGNVDEVGRIARLYRWNIPLEAIRTMTQQESGGREASRTELQNALKANPTIAQRFNDNVHAMNLPEVRKNTEELGLPALSYETLLDLHFDLREERGPPEYHGYRAVITQYPVLEAMRQPTLQQTQSKLTELARRRNWNLGDETASFATALNKLYQNQPAQIDDQFRQVAQQLQKEKKESIRTMQWDNWQILQEMENPSNVQRSWTEFFNAHLAQEYPQATSEQKEEFWTALRQGPEQAQAVADKYGWKVSRGLLITLQQEQKSP